MNKDQKIVIVTHEMFYGVPHALRDYLLNNKLSQVIFIGLPFIEQRNSTITRYNEGKKTFEKKIHQRFSGIAGYISDIFLTIFWVNSQKGKYNVYVGVDVLNSLSGIILKKMGKVEKVIFYAMDFVPGHFYNYFLNTFYHKVEEFCVKNVDEVWNVSPKIAEGREKFLHIESKKYPQRVVNSGIWTDKVKKFPFSKVRKHQLLFLGHLLEKQGLQMVLEATPEIIKKIPDFKFVILGGGEYEDALKLLSKQLGIQQFIEFKGWIKDREVIDTTLGESAAAVVLYIPEKEKIYNFSYYGDPIKLKEYLASGLPVILTDVPHNAREIEKNKCGFVVKYDKKEITNAIISLLGDEKKLKTYRENALKYAKNYDWNVIFSKVLN